jgi:conserved oligomeric Golgi complex subunit 3
LARYKALLTKALHLLEVGFTTRLDKVSSELAKQIAATQSESARHALAYGRFAEILFDSHYLLPNIRRVVRSVYDPDGSRAPGSTPDIYTSTANSLFHSYLAVRDRDLKPIAQHDVDEFKAESKSLSLETASRNFIKQSFEGAYNEANLFAKIFSVDPQWNVDEKSAFSVLKTQQRSLVNPANLSPLAANLLVVLQTAELKTVCAVVGWLAHEYLLLDYDEDESPFVRLCRELSARLLTEHLWPFADAAFEAELTKTISKTPVNADALKIGPVVGGVSSSNAYPPVKKALQLLGMFDQCMPKERSVSAPIRHRQEVDI